MELYLEDCGKRQSFTKFTQFKTTWCGALQFEIKMATYKLIFVLWGVGISIHFVTEHALLLLLFRPLKSHYLLPFLLIKFFITSVESLVYLDMVGKGRITREL